MSSDDRELIQRAIGAKNGDTFDRLWRGDLTDVGGDDSRADWLLVLSLNFWTGGDAPRIDRLFRQSGLMRPKWDDRRGDSTYGALTIRKALSDG